MANTLNNLANTSSTVVPQPSVVAARTDLILVHECCGSGKKLVTTYILEHPEEQVKVKNIGLINAKEQGCIEKYNLPITNYNDIKIHQFLIKDGKIIAQT